MKRKFTAREKRALRAEVEQQYENLHGARFYRNVDFLLYLCAIVIAALAIRSFLAEPIRVKGDSMTPTLISGEHMFVEKVSYWTREPARGDIIICFYPGYRESCVKRVIGLPGETVAISGGAVYIDGSLLEESAYWDGTIWGDEEPLTVGDNEVFVMGDNRNGSKDSRAASVGCIPYTRIVGHVTAVVWPLSGYREMERIDYPA